MLSEFRQDLVSGEWVLFATGRTHSIVKSEDPYQSKQDCPFEDPENSGQQIVWGYPEDKNWEALVIKNKYPAVRAGQVTSDALFGPFGVQSAVGEHELVVFKEHDKRWYDFSNEDYVNAIRVYKKRYGELKEQGGTGKYIMIFHNHGRDAGASLYHPHSQIITLPILPPDVARSLNGSFQYYEKNKKRVYDVLIDWEKTEKKRVVYENDKFIAFCPYVSKYPYEVRIFCKEAHAHFELFKDEHDFYLADILSAVFKRVRVVLDSPPFNFFIHTAPIGDEFQVNPHDFYQWHLEVIPHLKLDAGFELGTGIEINVVDPDEAAEKLRNA